MGSPEAGSLFIGNDESGYFRRHPKTETTLRSGHLDPPQPKKLGQRPLMVSLNGHGESRTCVCGGLRGRGGAELGRPPNALFECGWWWTLTLHPPQIKQPVGSNESLT